MKIEIRHHCSDFETYRAARVKSLFNVETGADFALDVDLPLDDNWQIGVVVGPSGSGKTSIGAKWVSSTLRAGQAIRRLLTRLAPAAILTR